MTTLSSRLAGVHCSGGATYDVPTTAMDDARARARGSTARLGAGSHDDFSSSFEPADPQPTWIDTAERAGGVTGPRAAGHPRQRHRQGRRGEGQRREHGRRRGQGEPRRRRLDTSGSSSSRPAGCELELAAAGHGRALRAHLGQRRPRARPAGLDAAGLRTTARPGRRSTRRPTRTSASASRPRSTTFANTTAYSYYRLDITRNHGDDLIQLAELQLSNGEADAAAGARHAQRGRQRPAQRLQRQVRRRLHRPARAPVRRRAHRRRPRLLLQQGLRRRRRRSRARRRALVPDLPRASSATTSATRARTPRSTSRFTDGTYLSDLRRRSTSTARRSARAARAPRRRSTRTSGTPSARASARSRPARRSTASSSATTTRDGPARLRRLDRRHRDRPARRARSRTPHPSDWVDHHAAARTPAAASRAATTSRRPPSRTASTSGRR